MSKKFRFRKSCEKQYGKRDQTMLESNFEQFYDIY